MKPFEITVKTGVFTSEPQVINAEIDDDALVTYSDSRNAEKYLDERVKTALEIITLSEQHPPEADKIKERLEKYIAHSLLISLDDFHDNEIYKQLESLVKDDSHRFLQYMDAVENPQQLKKLFNNDVMQAVKANATIDMRYKKLMSIHPLFLLQRFLNQIESAEESLRGDNGNYAVTLKALQDCYGALFLFKYIQKNSNPLTGMQGQVNLPGMTEDYFLQKIINLENNYAGNNFTSISELQAAQQKLRLQRENLRALIGQLSPDEREKRVHPGYAEAVRSANYRLHRDTLVGTIKICEQQLESLKPASLSYTVGTLGSLSRGEPSPYSDFEYLFLTNEQWEGRSLTANEMQQNQAYLRKLSNLVEMRLINLGEPVVKIVNKYLNETLYKGGMRPDEGGNNPRSSGDYQYICTPSQLKEKLVQAQAAGDIVTENILTNVASVYGDQDLLTQYQAKITDAVSQQTIIARMKDDLASPDFNMEKLTAGHPRGGLHIKDNLNRYPTFVINNLAALHGIQEPDTQQKINALEERHFISSSMGDSLRFMVDNVYLLRAKLHLQRGSEEDAMANKSVDHEEDSYQMDVEDVTHIQQQAAMIHSLQQIMTSFLASNATDAKLLSNASINQQDLFSQIEKMTRQQLTHKGMVDEKLLNTYYKMAGFFFSTNDLPFYLKAKDLLVNGNENSQDEVILNLMIASRCHPEDTELADFFQHQVKIAHDSDILTAIKHGHDFHLDTLLTDKQRFGLNISTPLKPAQPIGKYLDYAIRKGKVQAIHSIINYLAEHVNSHPEEIAKITQRTLTITLKKPAIIAKIDPHIYTSLANFMFLLELQANLKTSVAMQKLAKSVLGMPNSLQEVVSKLDNLTFNNANQLFAEISQIIQYRSQHSQENSMRYRKETSQLYADLGQRLNEFNTQFTHPDIGHKYILRNDDYSLFTHAHQHLNLPSQKDDEPPVLQSRARSKRDV